MGAVKKEAAPEPTPLPAGLEADDEKSVQSDAWARILLLGAAKTGKSTCVTSTAPAPRLVLNCDGRDALVGAATFGGKFTSVQVDSLNSWRKAVRYAVKAAENGEYQTICVDTVTLLADTLLDELKSQYDGYELWGQLQDELVGGIRDLRSAEAHLVVVAHPLPNDNPLVGILPSIPGKSASKIPAMLSDWVWFELDAKTEPPRRAFLVGAQKSWGHGGRNIKKSVSMDADVAELITELGLKP